MSVIETVKAVKDGRLSAIENLEKYLKRISKKKILMPSLLF